MNLQILTPGLELGQRDSSYVEKKVKNLTKYAEKLGDDSTKIKVELKQKRLKHAGEGVNGQITVFVPGSIIRAEVRGGNVQEVVDILVDKLKKQIERYKDKVEKYKNKKKHVVSKMYVPSEVEIALQDYEETREAGGLADLIVRRKTFNAEIPMNEEEAIEQMELLEHRFFLFLNQITGNFSVVYKREEGDYGIIELAK